MIPLLTDNTECILETWQRVQNLVLTVNSQQKLSFEKLYLWGIYSKRILVEIHILKSNSVLSQTNRELCNEHTGLCETLF